MTEPGDSNIPKPRITLPAEQVVRRRMRDGNNTGSRAETFEFTIKDEIAKEHNPILFPGEVIQYLLDKQGIAVEDFNKKLHYAPTYFQTNVFNTGANDGSHRLSVPLMHKMAKLTHTDAKFWSQRNFAAADIAGLEIDMSVRIHKTRRKYPHMIPKDNEGNLGR